MNRDVSPKTKCWKPLATALVALLSVSACATKQHDPPQVMVTPLTQYTSAAKGPECAMPILPAEPTRSYKQIAIVEGWGDTDQGPQVIEAARRSACETGADALLVLSSRSQTNTPLLYDATPNDLSEETNSQDANVRKGQYIHQKEYRAAPGEAGHTGFYLDTVAIVYQSPPIQGQQSAPASQPDTAAGPH